MEEAVRLIDQELESMNTSSTHHSVELISLSPLPLFPPLPDWEWSDQDSALERSALEIMMEDVRPTIAMATYLAAVTSEKKQELEHEHERLNVALKNHDISLRSQVDDEEAAQLLYGEKLRETLYCKLNC